MSELNFKAYGYTNDGEYLLSATEVHSTINDMMIDNQKEIEALKQRAEKAERELATKCNVKLGVGDGGGNLLVFGDYDSIKATRSKLLELEKLRAQLKGESND